MSAEKNQRPPAPGAPVVHHHAEGGCCTRLVNFGVRLGGVDVLRPIDLHVHCGELTALIGPNGAGKTTLLRAMLGELPHSGDLRFVHAETDRRFRAPRIGYVPQKLALDATAPITALDLFAAASAQRPLFSGHSARLRAETLRQLERVQAGDLLHRRLGVLPCGQWQRVRLALALTPQPDLLLLDEPLAGVDRGGIELFYHLVSQLRLDYDLSIILVSHDLAEIARVADRMILLNQAVLCDGAPRQVLADPLVREIFGFHGAWETPGDFAPPMATPPDHAGCPWPQNDGGAP